MRRLEKVESFAIQQSVRLSAPSNRESTLELTWISTVQCGLGEFNKAGGKVTTTCGPPAWPEGECRNSANVTANIGVPCAGWNDE